MGRAGVRKAEQITEFGEKKLAVGAFGGAGGGPACNERGGRVGGHGQRSVGDFGEEMKEKERPAGPRVLPIDSSLKLNGFVSSLHPGLRALCAPKWPSGKVFGEIQCPAAARRHSPRHLWYIPM